MRDTIASPQAPAQGQSRWPGTTGPSPRVVRWILCGPVVLLASFSIVAGMARWWPAGAAGVDQIVMPMLLFPLIWGGVFFYALLDDKPMRVGLVLGLVVLGHVGLLISR